jgi:DNA modification methylase
MKLLHGDCLVKLHEGKDGSVALVLVDLPYGTTALKGIVP